jgi:hypothetical protein
MASPEKGRRRIEAPVSADRTLMCRQIKYFEQPQSGDNYLRRLKNKHKLNAVKAQQE